MIEKDQVSIQYQIFMLLISVVSMVLITASIFIKDKETSLYSLLEYLDIGVCLLFFFDFCFSLYKAPVKKVYLKWGWIDLLASIPQIDIFRFGRVARVFRVISIFKAIKTSKNFFNILNRNKRKNLFFFMVTLIIMSISISSILILKFEIGVENSNIKNSIDALWWSFVTITTVGYGDYYPVTIEGRIVASVLMLIGICLFSSLSGIIGSFLLDSDGDGKVDLDIEQLRSEIKELKILLEYNSQKERDE